MQEKMNVLLLGFKVASRAGLGYFAMSLYMIIVGIGVLSVIVAFIYMWALATGNEKMLSEEALVVFGRLGGVVLIVTGIASIYKTGKKAAQVQQEQSNIKQPASTEELVGRIEALRSERQKDATPTHKVAPREWVEHAYPLQQITIQLQGTRHSERHAMIDQLEAVLARLRAGDLSGEEHDDDYGYRFVVDTAVSTPSLFDTPAGAK